MVRKKKKGEKKGKKLPAVFAGVTFPLQAAHRDYHTTDLSVTPSFLISFPGRSVCPFLYLQVSLFFCINQYSTISFDRAKPVHHN